MDAILMTLRALLATAAALQLLLLVVVADDAAAGAGKLMVGLPNCKTRCGRVSVPYPFGIEPGCFLRGGFRLTCKTSQIRSSPWLVLWIGGNQFVVTDISLARSTIRFWPRRIILEPSPLRPKEKEPPTFNETTQRPGCHLFNKLLVMDWEVGSTALRGLRPHETRPGNATCPRDLLVAACHSTHSTCKPTIGPFIESERHRHSRHNYATGYVCACDQGYQGNPYLRNGCQDINECNLLNKCFGNCTNQPGSFLCQCPKGTIGDPYARNGCVPAHDADTGLIIGLGAASGEMVLVVVIGGTFIVHLIQRRRKKKMRLWFFTRNRGQLLQKLVCQMADIAERMILPLEELEKATNNFDKARELGGGGHGMVYKGILSSLHVAAIKKSKIVVQREIDEFINEVAILSQINHKNIVRLLGCCLETDVPLLVYEFISNGTLYDHLHVQALVSLSWRHRLRIAVETARALAYLHSLVSMPIIHRDVKSPNILLDDNLTVKLSDFGASRYVPVDQSGLDTTVQGTFGYLDPMYHSTGYLTEKSDVYSFGVILIELLTRKKPVSYRSPQGHGLAYHFVNLILERNLADILDPQVVKEGGGEVVDISLLAAMCVKFESKDRPTMRQVEMTLESIHAAKEYSSSDNVTDESEEYYIQANDLHV
ncbi:unnamed protein product [Urochloa decumbens]|uniref:Protein kinase domain-containing protein n=1 Tax=Urochloa decumbens TaxID=240449 RepID=A0ABC8VUM7_9POAL